MSKIVYILVNPAMPDLVQIGSTDSLSGIQRTLNNLYQSNVPEPFKCFYAGKVKDADAVAKHLHQVFANDRVSPDRKFFRCNPDKILHALQLASPQDVTSKKETEAKKPKQALKGKKRRKRNFSFSVVKIPVGETLVFCTDKTITCKIVAEREVELNGEVCGLTAAARKVLRSKEGPDKVFSKAFNGTNYWCYEDEKLAYRRKRIEKGSAKSKQPSGHVFTFSRVNIPIGAVLNFCTDNAITCKVSGDKTVEFEGETHSLTSSAKKVMQKKLGADKSFLSGFAGTKHWCYENERISDRRARMKATG